MSNTYHDNAQHIDHSKTINISGSVDGLSDLLRDFLNEDNPKPSKCKAKQKTADLAEPKKKEEKPFTPTLAVFSKGPNTTVNQIALCYQVLLGNHWINENNPDSFMDLFEDEPNDCKICIGNVGVGNLQVLFQTLLDKNFIRLPQGASLIAILQSHFVDKDGKYINLRGAKSTDKAQQIIKYCVLCFEGKLTPQNIRSAFDSALE